MSSFLSQTFKLIAHAAGYSEAVVDELLRKCDLPHDAALIYSACFVRLYFR